MSIWKIIEKAISFFVGGLFIFSGLIKINDPVGTAIKLEEYFEVFAVDIAPFFHWFVPIALPLAVFLCVAEVVLGVALMVGFRKKDTVASLMLMVVFFTFLTFYSAYFNKVTDCGCFGDAIPLTPWESFTKDVVLTFLIGTLFFKKKDLTNTAAPVGFGLVGASTLFCLGIAWWVINHLPIIDFRDYKIGNNIAQLMQPQAPCQYEYIMTKDGEEFTFQQYPADKSYTFKEMKVLNEKECQPKITDYNVASPVDGSEYTEESLTGNKLLVIVQKVESADKEVLDDLVKVGNRISDKVETMVLTSDATHYPALKEEKGLDFGYYFSDGTVMKAMVRSNPGFLLLSDGKVLGKWHYHDFPSEKELLELLP